MSQPTLSNVKRKVDGQRNSESQMKIFRTKSRLLASIVNQVIKQINIDNPSNERAIEKSLHIAQSSISNIFRNAGCVRRKKRKVQSLTMPNIMKRRK